MKISKANPAQAWLMWLSILTVFGVQLSAPVTWAGEITCSAEVNRSTVPQGETVALTVIAEGDINWSADFVLPTVTGVQFFGGGTNQSVSYVNGQTMTTVSKSYYLKIETDDDFTIGPIEVTSKGNSCATDPITIKVLPASNTANPTIPPADTGNRVAGPSTSPGGQTSGGAATAAGGVGDDIFITLEADATDVWLGQQVILSFKYFRRIQPWNNPQFTAPRTEGFWREDLGQERRYRSVVQGRSYNVTEIRYALFPTRAGELVIEPAELSFPDQGLERFFSSRRRRGPRTLRTDPVIIQVKPLPSDRPGNFSGLVATDVRLEGAVDRELVPRGEPVAWTVQLVSDGFLKGFSGLEIPLPDEARTHDAGETFASQVEDNRLLSAITVEKVIVPGEEGLLSVPRVELSWFDAKAGKYRTARSSQRRVMVNPSNLPYQQQDDSGFLRSEVSRLAQDLAFIHKVPGRVQMGAAVPTSSLLWWGLMLAPVVLLAGWRFYLVQLSARHRDPAARRRRKALTNAHRLLKEAKESSSRSSQGNNAEGLTLVAKALAGFVADSKNLPSAAIGPAEVFEFGKGLGAEDLGQKLRRILEQTESARFGGAEGPGQSGGHSSADELADQTRELLGQLDKMISSNGKTKGQGQVLNLILALVLVGTAGTAQAQVDPARLMAEAGQAYTQSELDLALDLYHQALELGAVDPTLEFNLGNTYARRGELGRAVAHYLRAQRLDPRDPDISRNLDWVRSHTADLELGEGELPLFISQFVWVMRALTVREWSLILVGMVWCVCLIIGWGWYRGGFSDAIRRLGLVSGALLLVVAMIFLWRWHGEEVRNQAVVIVSEVSVRSGPEDSFPVLFEVHDGLTVFQEGTQQGWVRISLGGESLGWLPEAAILSVKEPASN